MFYEYLKLGVDHILDINGYDHLLFIATLCCIYSVSEWKKIFWLVTAFTIGHCLTLALSSLDLLKFNPDLVETLIPITIIITAFSNMYQSLKNGISQISVTRLYALPLGFGLIHGLGFSNYFKAILGESGEVVMPLFAFNVGVEIGQMAIVVIVTALGFLLMHVFKLEKKYWSISVSTIAIFVASFLLWQKMV